MKKFFLLLLYYFDSSIYAKFIGVSFGRNCKFYTRFFGSEPFLISFGNNVTVSNNVQFITHDGSLTLIRDKKGRRYSYSKIKVGSNVFIGSSSILLPGIEIGDNVIIGAGSVITKSIKHGSVVAGNPAKIISDFESFKKRKLKISSTLEDLKCFKNYKKNIIDVIETNEN